MPRYTSNVQTSLHDVKISTFFEFDDFLTEINNTSCLSTERNVNAGKKTIETNNQINREKNRINPTVIQISRQALRGIRDYAGDIVSIVVVDIDSVTSGSRMSLKQCWFEHYWWSNKV